MPPEDAVVGTVLVPGMPHLLAVSDAAPSWKLLADAAREAGRRLRSARPDAFLWLSTSWFTVLGHQFQVDPNPHGTHVDENWYSFDYGTIPYDLSMDVALAERWAVEAQAEGFQVRRTRYEGFPIDTGTITARRLLDPDGEVPLAQVSLNLYAEPEELTRLGTAAVRAARGLGRRVGIVVVSGLSSGLLQRWIEPHEDRIGDPDHDRWNRRVLDALGAGRVREALDLRAEYARAALADSQFRVLPYLAGTGVVEGRAEVLEYGPIWGTGAAVVYWPHRA